MGARADDGPLTTMELRKGLCRENDWAGERRPEEEEPT